MGRHFLVATGQPGHEIASAGPIGAFDFLDLTGVIAGDGFPCIAVSLQGFKYTFTQK